MDQRSTQAAVAIEPATPVSYRWTSPQTLELVPQGGSLAPATQYQVTVAPTATLRSSGTNALFASVAAPAGIETDDEVPPGDGAGDGAGAGIGDGAVAGDEEPQAIVSIRIVEATAKRSENIGPSTLA